LTGADNAANEGGCKEQRKKDEHHSRLQRQKKRSRIFSNSQSVHFLHDDKMDPVSKFTYSLQILFMFRDKGCVYFAVLEVLKDNQKNNFQLLKQKLDCQVVRKTLTGNPNSKQLQGH
jgi:hypothetical protein